MIYGARDLVRLSNARVRHGISTPKTVLCRTPSPIGDFRVVLRTRSYFRFRYWFHGDASRFVFYLFFTARVSAYLRFTFRLSTQRETVPSHRRDPSRSITRGGTIIYFTYFVPRSRFFDDTRPIARAKVNSLSNNRWPDADFEHLTVLRNLFGRVFYFYRFRVAIAILRDRRSFSDLRTFFY